MSYEFLDILCEIEAVKETSTVFIVKDKEVQEFEPDEAFGWLLDNEEKFKSCTMDNGTMYCMFDDKIKIDIW